MCEPMRDAARRGRELSGLIHEAAREHPDAMVKAFDQSIGEEVAAHTATLRKLHAAEAEIASLRKAHARCTNLTNAEAHRIFDEAREQRERAEAAEQALAEATLRAERAEAHAEAMAAAIESGLGYVPIAIGGAAFVALAVGVRLGVGR